MNKYYLLAIFLFFWTILVAQEKKVSLIFAGDAMQHTPQLRAAKTDSNYSYKSVFKYIKPKISSSDIAAINLETTLGVKPFTGFPKFNSPREYAEELHKTGFNLFFTANNHALDRGKEGLENTIAIIKEIGAKQTGTFNSIINRDLYYPLMIIKNGIRIAFLNYTYGTNGLLVKKPNFVNQIDTILIKEDIKTAKLLKPDIIIASLHWGEEYHTNPSKKQKELARFLFQNDVRIIIGHHPHVVQPIQINKQNDSIQQVVYYSLGNFYTNQRKPNTDGGMLAEIILKKDEKKSSVVIESAGYSLVWVHKYFKDYKPVYQILPTSLDTDTLIDNYNLKSYELKAMERFVERAREIIGECF